MLYGYSGLFGNCENATIKNLKLTDVNINDDLYYIGGVVVEVPPGTTIDKSDNILGPSDKGAGMTLPGGSKEVTLPDGSSIGPAGDVTVGTGGATVTLGNAMLYRFLVEV